MLYVLSLQIERRSDAPFSDLWFDDFEVELNSGLVAIIGNRGTGKSAITDILGICGDTHQNPEDFSFLNKHKFRNAKAHNFSEYFLGTLTWCDGEPVEKLLSSNPDKNTPERVKYIPQKLLEKLCSDPASREFRGEIEKIIFSHIDEEARLGFDSLEDLTDHKSTLINEQIARNLNELSVVNKEVVRLEFLQSADFAVQLRGKFELRMKELRAHEAIKPAEVKPVFKIGESNKTLVEISRLRVVIDDLRQEISSGYLKKNELIKGINDLRQTLDWNVSFDRQLSEELVESNRRVHSLKLNGINSRNVFSYKIDVEPIEDAILLKGSELAAIDASLDSKRVDSTAYKIEGFQNKLNELQGHLDGPARLHQEYLNRLSEWNAALSEINGNQNSENSIRYFEAKLEYLAAELPNDLGEATQRRSEIVDEIFDHREELKNVRKDLFHNITALIEGNEEVQNSYPMHLDVFFDGRDFIESLFALIGKGRVGTFYGIAGANRLQEIIDSGDFESRAGIAEFLSQIERFLSADLRIEAANPMLVDDQLRNGVSPEHLYDFIYGLSYLKPTYSLKLADKSLSLLSAGERGALLLIFFLSLDLDDIPLLIDQPEDNLDNESIFKDLIFLIKKAKTRRQVILVTHNPNLALGCDAEQIIHMKIDKENHNKISFESGGIEEYHINKSSVDVLEGTLLAFDNRGAKWVRK